MIVQVLCKEAHEWDFNPFIQTDRQTDKQTLLPESREIIFHHHFLEYIQFWTVIYGSVSYAFVRLVGPQNWVTNCTWVSTYSISEPTARSTNFWLLLLPFSIGVWGWGAGQYINWSWIESNWYCGAGRSIRTSGSQDHVLEVRTTKPFHGKTHFAIMLKYL